MAPPETPTSRLKNWTGTVHFAESARVGRCIILRPACGPVATHNGWLNPTVEDVTCERCIAKFGPTNLGLEDAPVVNEHVARRAAERVARRAARSAS